VAGWAARSWLFWFSGGNQGRATSSLLVFVVVGGVAGGGIFRKELARKSAKIDGRDLVFPPQRRCEMNSIMQFRVTKSAPQEDVGKLLKPTVVADKPQVARATPTKKAVAATVVPGVKKSLFGARASAASKGPEADEADARVRKVYGLIQAKTGAIGGNGSGGAMYGEITKQVSRQPRISVAHANAWCARCGAWCTFDC